MSHEAIAQFQNTALYKYFSAFNSFQLIASDAAIAFWPADVHSQPQPEAEALADTLIR